MSATVVAHVRQTLARFTVGDAPPVSPAERAAWAHALIDGADPGAAADQLVLALQCGEAAPDTLLAAARRLTGRHAQAVVAAAIDAGHVNARSYDSGQGRPAAGEFARVAAGSAETEDALLRAVLVTHPYEDRPGSFPHRNRMRRIAAVLAVLSDAHRDEPARLEHWSRILGDADRPRLAGAASLLAPLGLAEIDRHCGGLGDNVPEIESVPLVRALAEAGHAGEALELAARLNPHDRQEALVATARVVTDARDARAVVAAFRACPKGGRDRDRQMAHRHRFARMLLALGRVDDALTELSRMRDCRTSGFGPAPLAWELVRWLDQRPDEATGQRLRAVLDALASPHVIPQELAPCVAPVLHQVFVLADPVLRAEIAGARASGLRARLQPGDRALVDAGLAAGLAAVGRIDEATEFLRAAVRTARHGRQLFLRPWPLIEAAVAADVADRDRDLFAEVLDMLAAGASSGSLSPAVAVRLGPTGRAAAARLLDRFPVEHAGEWAACLAGAAAATGELDTLLALLAVVPDGASARAVGRAIAAALARRGELVDARAVADACGLRHDVPVAGAATTAGNGPTRAG
ncbi:hypothetical protein [Micromonospora citrea]|nr:hypothetical protein [Micromonospora citrea]